MVCVPCDGLETCQAFVLSSLCPSELLGETPDSYLVRNKWWLAGNEWRMLCITMPLFTSVVRTEEYSIDFQPDFTVFCKSIQPGSCVMDSQFSFYFCLSKLISQMQLAAVLKSLS